MLANDAWGSESEYKFHVLSNQLVAMFAGSPAKAKELALMYQDHLAKTILSEATALEEIRKPLAAFKLRKADWFVKIKLAVSYQDFLANGETWFGRQTVDRYLTAIEEHYPNVEMIIAGFIDGKPVLYQIMREHGVQPIEVDPVTNFCLIGSGATTAEPSLHARLQTNNTPLTQTLYNVYEAKMAGESSPYVGQKTRMYIVYASDTDPKRIVVDMVTEDGEKWLASLYAKHGPKAMKTWPTMPPKATFRTPF